MFLDRGDINKVLNCLELADKAPIRRPTLGLVYLKLGLLFVDSKDIGKALNYLELAKKLGEYFNKKEFKLVYLKLAEIFADKKDFDKAWAWEYLELARKSGLSDCFREEFNPIYQKLGHVFLDKKELFRAFECFREARKNGFSKEKLRSIYWKSGHRFLDKKELFRAFECFREAEKNGFSKEKINPIYWKLGHMFLDKKKPFRASDCFSKAKKNGFNNKEELSVAYFKLGRLYRECRMLDEALSCFKRAENNGFNNEEELGLAYFELGKKFIEEHMINQAPDCLRRAEECGFNNKEELGLAYFELGKRSIGYQPTEAIDFFKKESQIEDRSSEQEVLQIDRPNAQEILNSSRDNLLIERLPPAILKKIISFLPTFNLEEEPSFSDLEREMHAYHRLAGVSRTFYHTIRDRDTHKQYVQALQEKVRYLYPSFERKYPKIFSFDLEINQAVATLFREANVTALNKTHKIFSANLCGIRLNSKSVVLFTPLQSIEIKASSSKEGEPHAIMAIAEKVINRLRFTLTSTSFADAYWISEPHSSWSFERLESRDVENAEGSQTVVLPEGGCSLYEKRQEPL